MNLDLKFFTWLNFSDWLNCPDLNSEFIHSHECTAARKSGLAAVLLVAIIAVVALDDDDEDAAAAVAAATSLIVYSVSADIAIYSDWAFSIAVVLELVASVAVASVCETAVTALFLLQVEMNA